MNNKKYNKISNFDFLKLLNNAETIFVSSIRNTIILFTLGITIIKFSEKINTAKNTFALCLICSSILLGCVSIYEYNEKIKNLEKKNIKNYRKLSRNIYVISMILILMIILLIYKFNYMKNNNKLII